MKASSISNGYSSLLLLLISTVNVLPLSITKREILPPQCTLEKSGYYIPPEAVNATEAANYCQTMGGRLADINNRNVAALTAMVNECLGVNVEVRIQSWDSNTFEASSLILQTGFQSGAGTVSIAADSKKLYALCRMIGPGFKAATGNMNMLPGGELPSKVLLEGGLQAAGYESNRIQIPEEMDNSEGEYLDEYGMPIGDNIDREDYVY